MQSPPKGHISFSASTCIKTLSSCFSLVIPIPSPLISTSAPCSPPSMPLPIFLIFPTQSPSQIICVPNLCFCLPVRTLGRGQLYYSSKVHLLSCTEHSFFPMFCVFSSSFILCKREANMFKSSSRILSNFLHFSLNISIASIISEALRFLITHHSVLFY